MSPRSQPAQGGDVRLVEIGGGAEHGGRGDERQQQGQTAIVPGLCPGAGRTVGGFRRHDVAGPVAPQQDRHGRQDHERHHRGADGPGPGGAESRVHSGYGDRQHNLRQSVAHADDRQRPTASQGEPAAGEGQSQMGEHAMPAIAQPDQAKRQCRQRPSRSQRQRHRRAGQCEQCGDSGADPCGPHRVGASAGREQQPGPDQCDGGIEEPPAAITQPVGGFDRATEQRDEPGLAEGRAGGEHEPAGQPSGVGTQEVDHARV